MTKSKFEVDLDLGSEDLKQSVENQYEGDETNEDDKNKENSSKEAVDENVEVDTVDARDEEDTVEVDTSDKKESSSAKTEESDSEDTDEDVKDKTDKSQENTENKQSEEKPKKHSRFNKRVQELVLKTKEAEAYAAKVSAEKEAEIDALNKRVYEAEKFRVISQKQALTSTLDSLKRDFAVVAADNDYEKQAEIQVQMSKVGSQLAAVEGIEQRYAGEYKPEQRKQVERTNVGVDFDQKKALELSKDWEFDNPRVMTDKGFSDTATTLGKMLMERGFKPDTEEFYNELSSRIAKAYGTESSSKVKAKASPEEDDFSDEDDTQDDVVDTKKKTATVTVVKKKPTPQSVSGASRTPSPTGNSAGGLKVRLNEAAQATARNLGQDLKTYAKNYLKAEQGTDASGRIKVDLDI